MPSTYSPSLRIELIGEGEQDGIWGQTTNNNLGALIEQAISGITSVDVTAGDVTLTSFNGTVDQARSAVLNISGTPGVARNVIIPNESKIYIVNNACGQTVGIKTTSGSALNTLTGFQSLVYCDGANNVVGSVINQPQTTFTDPTVTGGTFTGGTFTSGTLTTPTINNAIITGIRETITVSAIAATGTIQFDTLTQAVLYYTSNATANWSVNFRGNSGTTLNSVMSTGQSFSATFMVTQGATAYINNAVTVDGVAVTPKWLGGAAPTAGNPTSVDIYNYVIIKTASATFSVFASQSQFK
jgi:hypothetical protein